MKHKLKKLWITVAMLLVSLSSFAYDFEVDGIYYNVVSLSDLTCEVKGLKGEYRPSLVIPSEVIYNSKSFTVVRIGSRAFYGRTSLTSIDLPDSITEIGYSAFEDCTSLTSIDLPDSITEINSATFYGCTSLTSIDFPDSLIDINARAFINCISITSISIPNSVTYIGEHAFRGCSSLLTISLSDNLKIIAEGLFENCTVLSSLTIPSSVNRVCLSDTFNGCENFTGLRIESSSNSLNSYYYDHIDIVVIPKDGWIGLPSTITNLFLDRSLDSPIPVPNLEILELGAAMGGKSIDVKNLNGKSSLNTIICHSLIPPTLVEMTNAQYMNLEVIVPDEALETYQNAPYWKNFWNLKGGAGMDETFAAEAKHVIDRVNTNGLSVDENYHGLVIIRYSDGSVRKVMQ